MPVHVKQLGDYSCVKKRNASVDEETDLLAGKGRNNYRARHDNVRVFRTAIGNRNESVQYAYGSQRVCKRSRVLSRSKHSRCRRTSCRGHQMRPVSPGSQVDFHRKICGVGGYCMHRPCRITRPSENSGRGRQTADARLAENLHGLPPLALPPPSPPARIADLITSVNYTKIAAARAPVRFLPVNRRIIAPQYRALMRARAELNWN